MQRQSLGSPGRTTSHKDDTVSRSEDSRRRDSSPSSTTSLTGAGTDTTDDDEIKPEKPLRCRHHHHNSHHYHQSEKFIHLIPLLILISFFILYLSSHDPSPQDMAQFNGFKHPQKLLDSIDIDEIGRIDRNEVLKGVAIRSLRNLQEEIQRDSSSTNKSRSHRKLGDF